MVHPGDHGYNVYESGGMKGKKDMRHSTRLAALLVIIGLTFALVSAADQTPVAQSKSDSKPAGASAVAKAAPAEAGIPDSLTAVPADTLAHKIIAYYFHGTRRCPSCKKIEAYSQEAVQTGFGEDLKSGKMEWRVVNTDDSPNEHYMKDYQLYTKSLVLSHIEGGKETQWKNLEKVWELLGDKEAFVKYVQDEVRLMAQEK